MNRAAENLRRFEHWGVALVVTLLGVVVLWPTSSGVMPLSADHTVHLARTSMWADQLAQGNLRGWSSTWFFGTPVGELYPVLGDALIIAIRWLSLGLVSWPTAYAVGFTIVFVAQGWVLVRAGRVMGWGPLPGLVAAALVLVDVGAYREGGWIYTVFYGVWPQSLATSLSWWGIAELCRACTPGDSATSRRAMILAGFAMGAALLAHPMSMLVLAIAGPTVVLTLGVGDKKRLRHATVHGLFAGALGLALAAWWLVPMLGSRGWMASYGWLWLPFEVMFKRLLDGHWCQSMPSAVGYCVAAGLLVVAVVGSRPARAMGAVAVLLWLMSGRDVAWDLRLDLVSEGFTHLQYQRFVTAAKPGLFLMAGAAIGALSVAARTCWGKHWGRRAVSVGATAVAVAACVWMTNGQREESAKNPMPEIQQTRMPTRAGLDADYAALQAWLAEEWGSRESFWRVAVRDQRNTHWFMDLPALADGVPILKLGFTPGDNFVHKPEKGPRELLDQARVRYEIRRGRRKHRDLVQTFGGIQVLERPAWPALGPANLRGNGVLEVLELGDDGDDVRVRVQGSDAETRLVFGVAGFRRWTLEGPSGDVEWLEAPVVGNGPTATQADRRSGALRGGKAHGDDGSEPTLIAADIGGVDGEYTLRYHRWMLADILALLASIAGFGAAVWMWRGKPRASEVWSRVIGRAAPLGHPIVWGTLIVALLVVAVVRTQRGRSSEAHQAYGWALDGHAQLEAASADFHKSDMLIRPAVVFARKHRGPAVAHYRGVILDDALTGWFALDDDDTKQKATGKQRLRVEARSGPEESWTTLYDRPVAHRPGVVRLSLETRALAGQEVELRVVAESQGKRPPRLAFDFDLGAPR